MSETIELPDPLFQRLQDHAEPLVDTPASVIRRVLDFYERHEEDTDESGKSDLRNPGSVDHKFLSDPADRESRERGAVIELDDTRIDATSVRDMYEKTLQYLDEEDLLEKIRDQLPISTSRQRHLLAEKPVHPNGSSFVAEAKYECLYMEAHKDWRNGINHLCQLLNRCGVQLTYHG